VDGSAPSASCHAESSFPEMPVGAPVTLLFTDIEGSTRLVRELRDRYGEVLRQHQRIVREAVEKHGGREVDTQGDSFFVAFGSPESAVLAAAEIQRALAAYEWPDGARVRVRIGVHTGRAEEENGRYTGLAVHRAARVCAAAHGGQTLVTHAVRGLLEDDEDELGIRLRPVGEHRLKDFDRPVGLFDVVPDGLEEEFPPPRTGVDSAPAAAPEPFWRRLRARVLDRRMRGVPAWAVFAATLALAAAAAAWLLLREPAAITVQPNAVGIIDPSTNEVVGQVPVGEGPSAVAVGEDAVWIANRAGKSVSVVDPATRTQRATIQVETAPADVAVGEDAVWVAQAGVAVLTRIDPRDARIVTSIEIDADTPVGRFELACGSNADLAVRGDLLWLVCESAELVRVDTDDTTRQRVKSYAGAMPSGVALSGDALWIANRGSHTVSRVDPASLDVVSDTDVGEEPAGLAVASGAVWVASYASDAVFRITVPAPGEIPRVGRAVPVGDGPVAVTVGEGSVWVANSNDGTVSRIDPVAGGDHVETIRVGGSPQDVAVGHGRVWVAVTTPPEQAGAR
jgi:YVTN family beta-propeller protein